MGIQFEFTSDDKSYEQTYIVTKYKPLWRFDNYWNMSTSQSRIFHTCLALIRKPSSKCEVCGCNDDDFVISEDDTIDVFVRLDWLCEIFNAYDLENYHKKLTSENGVNEKEVKRLYGKRKTAKNRVLKQDMINAVEKWKNINCWTYMGDYEVFENKSEDLGFSLRKGDSFDIFETIEIVERMRYGKKKKYIHIMVNPKFNIFMMPKRRFLSYDFNNIINLTAKNTIRLITLYEVILDLVRYYKTAGDKNNINTKEHPLIVGVRDNFAVKLNLDRDSFEKYDCISMLKTNILNPYIEKIKVFTDIENVDCGKFDDSYPYHKALSWINHDNQYLYFIIDFKNEDNSQMSKKIVMSNEKKDEPKNTNNSTKSDESKKSKQNNSIEESLKKKLYKINPRCVEVLNWFFVKKETDANGLDTYSISMLRDVDKEYEAMRYLENNVKYNQNTEYLDWKIINNDNKVKIPFIRKVSNDNSMQKIYIDKIKTEKDIERERENHYA